MDTPSARAGAPPVEATFNALPPELKAHIVHFIAKQESLDELESNSDTASDDGNSSASSASDGSLTEEVVDGSAPDGDGVMPTTAWADPPVKDSLRKLTRVNSELAALAFPYLWKRIDFIDRSTDSVLAFLREIVPRHAHHIRAIRFEQLSDEDEHFAPERVTKDLETLLPSAELIQRRDELATVARSQPWRLRSYVFAALVHALPRLELISFDLAPFIDRGEPVGSFANPAVDERVANALLRAIETHGARLTDLTIHTSLTSLDGRQLGAFLRSCPNLLRLSVELALRPGGAGDHELIDALTALTKLESLSISAAAWVNGTFARANWTAPLRILALNSCTEIWAEDLRTLVEKFGPTLDTLDLDDTPSAEVQSDGEGLARSVEDRRNAQGKDWSRPWRLPKLNYLVLACEQEVNFLDSFRESPIHTFELGYCPLINSKAIEAFITLGAERTGAGRLREVRMTADADLSEGQREGIEVLCFAKRIQCKVEQSGSWESDYPDSELEDDVEEVEAWTDDDDEDGWEMDDREDEEDEESGWVSDEE